jgi:amino acid adenylation domain-containing protein
LTIKKMEYGSIKTLFENQVDRCSERTAVSCGGRSVTFGDLNRRANQVARALRRGKVAPGAVIGVYMRRSIEMLVGLLGVVKAGAAYLPLDPGYPQKRISYLIEDSGVRVILCADPPVGWRETLGIDPGIETIDLCASESGIDGENDGNPALGPVPVDDSDRLAYVIYTSGSTGRPKGALGTERGMLNRLHWMWERFPFRADEIGCVKTSLSFLDSFWEIFGHLLQGVPLILAPDAVVKDPEALARILEEAGVTRLVVVPSLLESLLSNVHDIGARLHKLTLWVTSGEALDPELADLFRRKLPRARLLNLYGSSEVSADCAWYDVAEFPLRIVGLGRPIPNNELHILDEWLRPAPAGVSGEIYVGGVGLAWGYLGRADLTAERFIADPFGVSGGRLFRTGDLGRRRSDGMIEYLGRADHQVKIRGFRIELGEIEIALRSHSAVSQAAVVVRKDGVRRKQIVAYVTPAGGQNVSGRDLREFLAERLPDYMAPAAIIPLPALPLTPSGKLDRNALPAPDYSRQYQPPQTRTENLLTHLFAEVLELKQVGVDDKFFELGGDSLSLVDLVARARTAGLAITHLDVFQHQTPKALAAALSPGGKDAAPRRDPSSGVAPQESFSDGIEFKPLGGIDV